MWSFRGQYTNYGFVRILSTAKKMDLVEFILTNDRIKMLFSKIFDQLTLSIPEIEAPQPQSISRPRKSAIKTLMVKSTNKDPASKALLRVNRPETKNNPQKSSIQGKNIAGSILKLEGIISYARMACANSALCPIFAWPE